MKTTTDTNMNRLFKQAKGLQKGVRHGQILLAAIFTAILVNLVVGFILGSVP